MVYPTNHRHALTLLFLFLLAIVIQGIAQPTATVSATTANGTYTHGQSITITVTFSEAVTVACGASTSLSLETGLIDRTATYTSGSGSTVLTFTYSIQKGDNSADLDYISTSALSGCFTGAVFGAFTPTLPTPNTAGSLRVNKNIVISDTSTPVVSGVNSTVSDGVYTPCTSIIIFVFFDEPVFVTGTPRLQLETGTTDQYATYTSGSGATNGILSFTYTVQLGDASVDLAYVSTSALTLNGGSILDAVNKVATLTLPAVGAPGSLNANKNFVIDGSTPQAPTGQAYDLTFTSISTNSLTLSWTNGNGLRRMVVARAGSSVDANPVNGTPYTASATFGSGSQIGTGNYVVYNSTGNSVTVTGLTANMVYYFKVYEYNGPCSSLQVYNITEGVTNPASRSTLATQPSNPPSPNSSSVTSESATITWSKTGTYTLVVLSDNNFSSGIVTDGSSYTANSIMEAGQEITNGVYVVYNGTGTSVTVTNLRPMESYLVYVYEFNGTGGAENYTSGNSRSFNTTTAPEARFYSSSTLNASGSIQSTDDSSGEQELVLPFIYYNTAGSPSLQEISILPGNNNELDWSEVIQGARIECNTCGGCSGINGVVISSSILFNNTGGCSGLWQPGTSGDEYQVYIYLKTSIIAPLAATIDGKKLDFKISNESFLGGPLDPDNTAVSNVISVQVSADRLKFVQQPSTGYPGVAMQPSVTVEATDVNGNRDLDWSGVTTLSGTGLTLTPLASLIAGLGTYGDIIFDGIGINKTVTTGNTSGLTNATSSTFNIISPSVASDADDNASFAYTSNIPFIDYQEAGNLTVANSVAVGMFDIRDGGASGDSDYAPTILTSLTLTGLTPLFRRLALYDGTTELAEQAVSGSSVTFSGLSVTVADNSSKSLTVRASFVSAVSDNTQVQMSLTSAAAALIGSSGFSLPISGAQTSIAGDNNRLEVTATKLEFISQPPSLIKINTSFGSSPQVIARDALNNQDVDYNASFTLSSVESLSFANAPTASNWNAGILTFPSTFMYTSSNTTRPNGTLTVASGALTSAISNSVYVDGSNPTVVLSDDHPDNLVRASDVIQITATFTDDDVISEVSKPRITIADAGISNVVMTKSSNTVWTYNWSVPEAINGTVTVSISASDVAGNTNATPTGQTVYTIDNTGPSLVLSTNDSDNIASTTATVLFTATFTDANAIDEITIPTISVGNIVSNAPMTKVSNLVWTYQWDVPDSNDGPKDVIITATDVLGNAISASAGVTSFIIDNSAPTVMISDDHPDNIVGGTEAVKVIATFTDETSIDETSPPLITIGAVVDAPMTKTSNTEWYYNWDVPSDTDGGPVYRFVTAKDVAGNAAAAPAGKNYTIDNTAPTVSIADNHPDNIVKASDDVVITASFTDTNAIDETDPPKISIGTTVSNSPMTKVTNKEWTYAWSPAGNENATVSILAKDLGNNSSTTATGKVNYIVDNTVPAVVVSSSEPDNIVKAGETVLVTATFTDTNGINETIAPSITFLGSAANNSPMTKVNNLTWTYMWTVPDGDFTSPVSISATDAAGNSNSAATGSISWIVDNRIVSLNDASSITQFAFTASWTQVDDASGYAIDLSTDNFSTFVAENVQTANTSHRFEALSPGTRYQYRVRFLRSASVSANSSAKEVVTVPPAPLLGNASDVTTTSFRANWDEVPSANEYFIDVSNNAFGSLLPSYTNISVLTNSIVVSGLSPGTVYHYRVRAKNESGTSPNSVSSSQITVPSKPQSLAVPPDTRTSDGFIVQWAEVTGAEGYYLDIVDVTTSPGTIVPEYNAKMVTGTFHSVSGLKSATNYSVFLRAFNEGGISVTSDPTFTQTKTSGGTNVDPDPALQVSYTKASSTLTVTIVNGSAPYKLFFLHRQISTRDDYTEEPEVTLSTKTYALVVSAGMLDEIGMEYSFRLVDNIGRTYQTDPAFIYADQSEDVIQGLTAGGRLKDYAIFSVPYVLDDNNIQSIFEPVLGKYDKAKWRLVRYQNGKNVDYTDGLNKIEIGKGYWFNSKTPVEIDVGPGSIPAVDRTHPFEMILEEGWTQIGDPFNFDVSWTDILASPENAALGTTVDPEILVFDQSTSNFKSSDLLKPWSGAFAYSTKEQIIKIPVTLKNSTGGRKASHEIFNRKIDEPEWFVPIRIEQGSTSIELNGFGMHPEADLSKDRFDKMIPPRFVHYLEFYTTHRDQSFPWFRADVVPTADSHAWDFTIESTYDGERIELHWDNFSMGNNESILMLYDREKQSIVDMKKSSSYVIDGRNARSVRIVYSRDRDYFDPGLSGLIQSYPNPFDERVTIPFLIDEKNSNVAIRIMDLQGNTLAVPVSGTFDAGLYEGSWDGKDIAGFPVASGHYFCRMEVNGFSKGVTRLVKTK